MIANRVAQLESMLAEHGITERTDQLLDDFGAAAATWQRRQGFGEVCQHYFNLRVQGTDHVAAVATIAAARAARQ